MIAARQVLEARGRLRDDFTLRLRGDVPGAPRFDDAPGCVFAGIE
jgi:hypothetical protein